MATVGLVVGNTGSLTADDTATKDRLVNTLGHTVTLVDDTAALDQTGIDAFLLSSSGDSAAIYKPATIPVMAANNTWREMDLANNESASVSDDQVSVIDSAHPLAAGKTGTQTVYASVLAMRSWWPGGWGSGAEQVVTPATSGRVAIAEYDSGATIADGTAAAGKRVAFGLVHTDPLNATGWDFFDAAVRQMVPDGGGGGEHHSTTTDPLDIPLTYGQADAAKTASVSGAALALGVTYGQAPAAKHGTTAGDPQTLGVSLGQAPAAKHATASGDPITLGVTYAVAPAAKHASVGAAPLSLALTLAPAVTDATEQHTTTGDPLDLTATLGQATGVKHAAVTATPLNLGLVFGQGQTTPQLNLAALDLTATVTPRQHTATVQPRQYAAAVDTETYDATVEA